MKKTTLIFVFILLPVLVTGLLFGQDYRYQVTGMYDTDGQGKILQKSAYGGWITLFKNGTYKLKFHIEDEGTYQYVKANAQQPNDTIYFNSKKNFRFFAYPRQNSLEVWLFKTDTGANRWIHAELAANPPASSPGTTDTTVPPADKKLDIGGLINNGLFTKKVIYGNTNINIYYLYDRATGSITADEKGIIFRPDGTYFLRSEFGSSVFEGKGNYRIVGDKVQVVFSDNSSMTLNLVNGGKALYWYSNGMLISEYYFLGVVK